MVVAVAVVVVVMAAASAGHDALTEDALNPRRRLRFSLPADRRVGLADSDVTATL